MSDSIQGRASGTRTGSGRVRRLGRAALIVALGLMLGTRAGAAGPFDQLLPNDTVAIVTIQDVAKLRQQWKQTNMGRALADPSMRPFLDDVREKFRENKGVGQIREQLGMSLAELLNLPQGQVAIGLRVLKQAEAGTPPVAFFLLVDVGQNKDQTAKLMERANEKIEAAGGKKRTEEAQGTTLTIIEPKDQGEGAKKRPPAVWFMKDTVLGLGTDVGTFKELLAHWDAKAENSLSESPIYQKVLKKVGEDASIHWFIDFSQVINLVGAVAPGGAAADPANVNAMLQLFGLDKLKAFGGSLAMATDKYDGIMRSLLQIEGKPAGLLRIMTFPTSELKPESWVPASVSAYTTINWDIAAAYGAIADVVNTFQPGALDQVLQKLAGPDANIDIKKDVIDAVGNRISYLVDIKKPITISSQRALLSIALKDAKTFGQTVEKLAGLGGEKVQKREFQGQTIYEIKLNLPANLAGQIAPGGAPKPVSVTVSQDRVLISTDPALLESVLRQGESKAQSLADSPAFQEVSKSFPGQASSIDFNRPDQQMEAGYETFRKGQLTESMKAAGAANPAVANVAKAFEKFFDGSKLPPFSEIRKYLAPGGGYIVADEDGIYSVSISLKQGAGSAGEQPNE